MRNAESLSEIGPFNGEEGSRDSQKGLLNGEEHDPSLSGRSLDREGSDQSVSAA